MTQFQDKRWIKRAVLVWVVALLVCSGRPLLQPHASSVYPIFADAGANWLAGRELYRSNDHPYRYSPLVAAFLAPWSLLPAGVGGALWRVLNAAIYLPALAWWGRTILPGRLTRSQRGALFLLIVPLSLGNVYNGQCNPLVLGLLLASLAAVRFRRWNLASAGLAVACLFKGYPLAIALLLAALYPRQLAGRLALALGLGLALPLLLQHPAYVASQTQSWFHYLRHEDRQELGLELWYRDLRLLAHLCRVPLTPAVYLGLQLVGAAVVLLSCLLAQRHGWSGRRLLTWLLALGCFWMTVLGAAAESCTYILLAPSLAGAVLVAQRERWPVPARALLLLSFGLFLVTQAAVWFPFGKHWHTLGLHPLAALLFLAGFVIGELCKGEPARRIPAEDSWGESLPIRLEKG
jgi:hypothetical protein